MLHPELSPAAVTTELSLTCTRNTDLITVVALYNFHVVQLMHATLLCRLTAPAANVVLEQPSQNPLAVLAMLV